MATVLLVDGDVLVRVGLAAFLRDCGLRVVEASSAADARTFVADPALGIDIALIDANLAGAEDAFSLAGWLRRTHREIDIVLAGSPEHAIGRAAELCRGGPALPKPYDPKGVLDRINRLRAARDRRGGD